MKSLSIPTFQPQFSLRKVSKAKVRSYIQCLEDDLKSVGKFILEKAIGALINDAIV